MPSPKDATPLNDALVDFSSEARKAGLRPEIYWPSDPADYPRVDISTGNGDQKRRVEAEEDGDVWMYFVNDADEGDTCGRQLGPVTEVKKAVAKLCELMGV